MIIRIRMLLFAFGLLFAFVTCQTAPPDLLLINGKVWTGTADGTFVEAVAVRGNRIDRVGTTADLSSMTGAGTQIIDLNGRLVIPGFNDAHIHFLGGSIGLTEVDLFNASNPSGVVAEVNRYAEAHPSKAWITGRGWQYTWFKSGLPTFEELAGINSDRPVLLTAYDGHSAWANAKALELAGITANSEVPGYGRIIIDSQKQITGALLEDAQNLVEKIIPEPTRTEKLDALRLGLERAASFGITSLQNASGSMEELALYKELLKNGELTVRYAAALSVNEHTTPEQIEAFRQERELLSQNPYLRADAIKFMLDGVIESHTAAMLLPYDDAPGVTGDFAIPLEAYKSQVMACDKAGFRLYTHAIGDRAVREALNAYEAAAKQNGKRPRRHRVEHIETISPDDVPRFAQLGVLASMEPIHADPATMDVWQKAIGAERLPFSFAWASMLSAGAKLVYSSDWPDCIDLNPIHGLHVAVNRRTTDGYPEQGWVAGQKIPLADALLAYTYMGAYSSFEEGVKGQIKTGMLADLVVLSDDLFTIDPMKIGSTKVDVTIFDGRVIYERAASR